MNAAGRTLNGIALRRDAAPPWLAITLILLFAALARSLHIAEQSFWVDEGYAFYHAHHPSLIASLARDTHPPLYFAALRLWSELTGHSELALRWFSLLPSMLGLAVVYQLAREMGLRRRAANPAILPLAPPIALLLLALADAEIFLAQEARHYTWLALLVSFSALFLLRWLRAWRRRDRVALFASCLIMLHAHYLAAFGLAALALYALLWLRGRQRRAALAAMVGPVLLTLPWLLLVGLQQLGNRGANWSVDLSPAVLQDILVKYFTAQWSLTLCLVALGCLTLVHRRDGAFGARFDRATPLLLLWLLLPFCLTVVANEFLPFLQPRRLNQWTPAIALLAALGLANIRQPIRGLLLVILIVYGVAHVDFYRVKPDWRGVAEMTARFAAPGDLVMSDIGGGDYQLGYYLRRRLASGALLAEGVDYESIKIQRDFHAASFDAWLPAQLEPRRTVWLTLWSDHGGAQAWLDKLGFVQTAHFIHLHDGGLSGEVSIHAYRYDRLQDERVAEFANGMVLRRASLDMAELRLDTHWQATVPLERDFMISAKLLDAAGAVVAQHDGPPQLGARPTSGWLPGEIVYSPHAMDALDLPPAGEYQIIAQVYAFEAGSPQNVLTTTGAEYALIQRLRLPEDS